MKYFKLDINLTIHLSNVVLPKEQIKQLYYIPEKNAWLLTKYIMVGSCQIVVLNASFKSSLTAPV